MCKARPKCIDVYVGYGDRKITCYDEKYEDCIWDHYDKKKFWLKDKGHYFLMIECKEGDFTQYDYDQVKKERETKEKKKKRIYLIKKE